MKITIDVSYFVKVRRQDPEYQLALIHLSRNGKDWPSSLKWRTQMGSSMLIKHMADSHVINIYRMLTDPTRSFGKSYLSRQNWIIVFMAEMIKRKIY